MVEFGPALFVLSVGLLFPLIDLVGFTSVYAMAALLNDAQLREAALLPHELAQRPSGPVIGQIPNSFAKSGFGAFSGVVGAIKTSVSYQPGVEDSFGLLQQFVSVRTNITVSPLLPIPLPISVPALNSPIELQLTAQRPLEDPTNAP